MGVLSLLLLSACGGGPLDATGWAQDLAGAYNACDGPTNLRLEGDAGGPLIITLAEGGSCAGEAVPRLSGGRAEGRGLVAPLDGVRLRRWCEGTTIVYEGQGARGVGSTASMENALACGGTGQR